MKLVDENWKSLTDNSNRLQKSKEELQPKVDALPKQKVLEQDLELLFRIKTDESKLAKNAESTIDGEKFVKEFKSKEEETSAKIQNQDQEIASLKTQLISSATLIEVGEWFSKKQNLEDNLGKEKTNFEANKKSIEVLDEKLKNIDVEKLSEEILKPKVFLLKLSNHCSHLRKPQSTDDAPNRITDKLFHLAIR